MNKGSYYTLFHFEQAILIFLSQMFGICHENNDIHRDCSEKINPTVL